MWIACIIRAAGKGLTADSGIKTRGSEARGYLGKRIPGTGNPGTKTKQESSWHVTGMARRPVWVELSG